MLVRPRVLKGDVVVQVKVFPFLPGRGWLWSWNWRDFTQLSSVVYSIEWEAIEKLDELEEILQRLELARGQLELEVKEVETRGANTFGIGEPFELSRKKFKDWAKPFTQKPQQDWHWKIGHKWLMKYKLDNRGLKQGVINANKPHKPNAPSGVAPGGRTAYTLDEVAKKNVHIDASTVGADTLLAYREEKDKSKGKSKNSKDKSQIRADLESEGFEVGTPEYNRELNDRMKNRD